MAATTFEFDGGALRSAGTSATLQGASQALPDGAYSTLRTYGGDRVLRLGRHVERLNESAILQGSTAPLDEGTVRAAIARALTATSLAESRIRLTFAPPRLFVSIEPFTPPPEALYRDGVACVTVPLRRRNPHAKDTRFTAEAAKAYATLPVGVHEGLMVADDGTVLEGLSSNVFVLAGGVLRTEEARVLLGVTRSLVLEVAQEVVPILSEGVRIGDLPSATEAFLTSASRGILPVVRIDGTPLGDGRPGPVTRDLMARFQALVDREARSVAS
ncbi:MAG: aminotransferase class IV [Vicinamibacteria bacterium]